MTTRGTTAALAMILGMLFRAPAPVAARKIQKGTLIHLPDGDVQGTVNGKPREFPGTPSAAPPPGDRRWRPPAPPTPWQGVLQANTFGPACAQTASIQGGASDNEDCLYLNVWTPD